MMNAGVALGNFVVVLEVVAVVDTVVAVAAVVVGA